MTAPDTAPLALVLAGAGLIGRRHWRLIDASPEARLAGVADPAPAARAAAEAAGLPWAPTLAELLDATDADGAVIATPNLAHEADGLAAIATGLPALVEKPLAHDSAAAARLVAAADSAGVPLLVGHHRRHNPLIARAKAQIAAGAIGDLTVVDGQFWLKKPDDYFAARWRTELGGGPIYINLIHDMDLLRGLCGEIVAVRALTSSAQRGHLVEDAGAVLMRFKSGALGAFTLSDTTPSPWSWELTAAENPAYPPVAGQDCYRIGGTLGAIGLPSGAVWRHPGDQSWMAPIAGETIVAPPEDPLPRQLAHFCAVIRGEATPLVTAQDGLQSLRVIEAIARSAAEGGEEVSVALA